MADEYTLLNAYEYTPISLSTINFDLTYTLNNLQNINQENKETLIEGNSLVVSMLDDKMYYNRNTSKSSYQYNNLLFINNEKDIVPLSLNIQNIDSALTINNGEIQLQIDNNTIIDKNNELSAYFANLKISENDIPGIFKVDNNSLIIEDNQVNISYNITEMINDLDDHILDMNNIIDQCSYNLNQIIKNNFKDYPLYNYRYTCNIDQKHNLYYYDDHFNNDIMKMNDNMYYHFIDYYQKYFKVKIRLLYNYSSSHTGDFNAFDENNLNIVIENNSNDTINIDATNYIEYNANKSFIFDTNVTSFEEETKNIYGEIDFMCHFNILNDKLYDYIDNLSETPNHLPFKITFNYYDPNININTYTIASFDLCIDTNYKKDQIHQILYHDYNVGFNYDKIGKIVGICMIPTSNNYSGKSIFMKYFKGEKNYVINRISNDIFNNIDNIFMNNINISNVQHIQLFNNNSIINNSFILYKDINPENSNFINLLYNTKSKFGNNLEYAFNNTYNIYGNGLRKGDCYVPNIYELSIFYQYGFNYYINEIDTFDSSTLRKNNDNINFYSINCGNNSANISENKVGLLKINENGEYVVSGGNNVKTQHQSVSLFKLPDFSVLSSPKYYLQFNENENCELISYSTNNKIDINIKSYNPENQNINFILKYDKTNLNLSPITIKSNNDIYTLSFEILKYDNLLNDIEIYYHDLDNGMNVDDENAMRKLCKLSLKIK